MNANAATTHWDLFILHGVKPTGKEIGRGAYGRVFEVNYEGILCAAKEVHALLLQYAQGQDLQKIKEDFLNECQLWSALRHPCVVRFLGVYYPAMDQYRLPVMVMEKMQHSLRGLVEKYDNIPLNVKLYILDEVCLGLRYLHSRNPPIIHRDLTPNNILLSYRLEAKITDMGVAKVMKSNNRSTMTKIPGTPDFMPPEALSRRPEYGPSLDVFSYGGVILNVTTQLWPEPTDRSKLNPDTDVWEIVSEVKRRQHYFDKMAECAADLKPLAMSCLNDNPKNRPPVAQVSMTIKRIKDVCSGMSSHDGISPIIWWAEVSNEQQSQVASSLTMALEELRSENNVLKTENTELRTSNDAIKDENKQLTILLDKMAVNNENQMQQINFMSSENATIKDENKQLKTEVQQLKQQLVQKESTTPGNLFNGSVNIKWIEGPPASMGFCDHTAVYLDGLVYLGGGYKAGVGKSCNIDCYDPVNNSWKSPINTLYHCFSITVLNNKLLIAGGWDKSLKTTNQILTMDAGQLQNYTKMNIARSHATANGHQGMLIITGGLDYKYRTLSSTELFNSNNDQWYICSDLPQPHYWLQSVIIDNYLYLLGGSSKYDEASPAVFTASLDTLSKQQLKWKTCQDTPCCWSAPVNVHGTHLFIIGGIRDKSKTSSDVYKLSKISHKWEAIGHIPSPRHSLGSVCTAGKIIVFGGVDDKREFTKTVWVGTIGGHSS